MPDLHLLWQRVQGRSYENCRFSDTFRSNGDGQVTRVHLFCRAPQSPYCDRPAPAQRWCPAWTAGNPQPPPQVGNPDLTI